MHIRNVLQKFFCILFFCQTSCAASLSDSSTLNPSSIPDVDGRRIVLVSDFHMGAGKIRLNDSTGTWTEGPWHPTEDFRWHGDFKLFLERILEVDNKKETSTDLIIVGDFLELWQSPGHKCGIKGKRNLGCSESQALDRLKRVSGAHHKVMELLGKFASIRENRLIIIPGNHDAALVYNQVAKFTIDLFQAPAGKVLIAKEGYWLSSDGKVFVEHGHQMEGDVNEFRDRNNPAFCIDKNEDPVDCNAIHTTAYLQRTWGENFVQSFYNRYEEKFPIIDNLSNETLGVQLGVNAFNTSEVLDTLGRGLKFFLLQQTVSQFSQVLGDGTKKDKLPKWDFEKIRKKKVKFFIESMPKDDPIRIKVENLFINGDLKFDPMKLSENEINQICDNRSAMINQKILDPIKPCEKTEGDSKGLRSLATTLLRSEKSLLKSHISGRYQALPAAQRPKDPFKFFIYGHTHKAKVVDRIFEEEGWHKIKVFNTGAWQRVATPGQLKKIQEKKVIPDDKALLRLRPENLYPCYTYVNIPKYDSKKGQAPNPSLLFWAKVSETSWEVKSKCPFPGS